MWIVLIAVPIVLILLPLCLAFVEGWIIDREAASLRSELVRPTSEVDPLVKNADPRRRFAGILMVEGDVSAGTTSSRNGTTCPRCGEDLSEWVENNRPQEMEREELPLDLRREQWAGEDGKK
jgi:hypothetical protein